MKHTLKKLAIASALFATGTAMAGVTLYEGEGFQGRPLTINNSASDFRAFNFNDRARSMIVTGSPMEVCVDIQYGGGCQVFNPGQYATLGQWTDAISSVRPATFAGNRPYRSYNYNDPAYNPGYNQGYNPNYDRSYNDGYRDNRDYNYRDNRRDNPLNELGRILGF